MYRRLFSLVAGLFVSLTPVVADAATAIVSAASRKTHNVAGVPTTFDIPLTGSPAAVECRTCTGASGLQIVFRFDQPVQASVSPASTATITGAAGATAAAPVFGTGATADTVTVTLSGLADKQTYTVTLTNVVATADSSLLASTSTQFRTLLGDVNGSGSVTVSDTAFVKSQSSYPVNSGNFRCDVNANGAITVSDSAQVKSLNTNTVPGGSWVNTAPSIGTIADQAATSGVTTLPVGFVIGDTESPATFLYVSATSSDQVLLPNANIAIAGSGANQTLSVTPAGGQTGTCVVTVTVSDGILSTPTTFNVTVTAPSTLYLATMTAQGGAATTGTGTATLEVNAAGTQAILRFQYSNLTSPKVSEHLHLGAPGVAGPIIYDIDTPAAPSPPAQQADGSYLWIFDPNNATYTPAQIAADIAAGNYYINIHSVNYPNGEIRGQFNAAAGSQTFTIPSSPPAQPLAAPTIQDVSRFLTQATFGSSLTDIAAAQALATNNTATDGTTNSYDAWLNAQFAIPTTSIYGDVTNPNNPKWTYTARVGAELNGMSSERVVETFWHNAITAPDQLRQRVAFAYSQIFVVSSVDGAIDGQSAGVTTYHDMLANNAFGNFRQLLEDVTLHPVMGQYLNMRGNYKQTLPAKPNENYAREILQLFAIGLNVLQPDGTLKLSATGLPIPSYDQSVIEGFAQVFTGYNTDGTISAIDSFPNLTNNGTINLLQTYNNTYRRPMVVVSSGSQHSTYRKDLLSYTGNYSASSPDRYIIPAAASHTTASTNLELKQALDNIFNHPNVGPFVCKQLIQRLVGGTPSPAYVYRVAKVFDNDGTGVRGNMKAVVRAILVDREARAPQSDAFPITNNPGYGHLREPMLSLSQGMRAFHPDSSTGYFKVSSSTAGNFGQAPYRSPTVFNFFYPDYSEPGPVATAKLISPELSLATENTTVNMINTMYNGVYNSGNWPGSDIHTHVDTLEGFNAGFFTASAVGSTTLTVSTTNGLAVGETLFGSTAFPNGTTITAIAPNNILVTLSLNATGTLANASVTIGAQVVTTNLSNANATFLVPGTTTGLAVGQAVSGTNIPAGAIVAGISTHPSTVVTISNPVTATFTNATLNYGTQVVAITTTNGSPTVTVNDRTNLAVGQVLYGTGLPTLCYITAVPGTGPGTITVSANATSTVSNMVVQYSAYASELQLADVADVSVSPPTGVPASASALAKLGLIDRLNVQLMGGQMPASMKTRIATYVNSLSRGTATTNLARARAAVNLVLSSPQYATQK